MDARDLLKKATDMAGDAVLAIDEKDWGKQTPCSEWDLKALIRHMVYELVWIPDLLAGKTVEEVGDKYEGDILGNNPVLAWRNAVKKAADATKNTDLDKVIHLSAGDSSVAEYINEVAADLLLHGWDTAKSLDVKYELSDELLSILENLVAKLEAKYKGFSVFATPLEAPANADRQTKLLAHIGRRA